MEKLQFDNDYITLYSPDTLNSVNSRLQDILLSKIEEYKKLFNIENYRKVIINYFDDINKFREFIYNARGEKESLPSYATGTFDKGMINLFIDPEKIQTNSTYYDSVLYAANHELFHIMYKEIVLKNDYSKRIIWYDEGMAEFMSGEISNFNDILKRAIDTTKEIPDLNSLSHGNSFINDKYNGYLLSYVAIHYLYDTLSNEEFKSLLSDFDKIKLYGQNIVDKAFSYYKHTKIK